ncbi:MAG: mechanosensitive ion channel family protein [Marinomonas atlantica]|nr:mechanosensitive ion channel family protein [Marinomonas atlantica]
MKFIEPLHEKAHNMWLGTIEMLPLFFIAIIVLLLTWCISAVLTHLLRQSFKRSNIRPSLRDLFVTLTKVTLWTIGVLFAVTVIFPSLTPAKLLTVLGLGSVAVGLAFKDIFENFFAGILIMLRKPMRINDYIECEGISGRVEKITVRETYLREVDDQLIVVPNSFLFKNPLYILTDLTKRRFDLVVGVAYGEDVNKAREVIIGALENIEEIDQDRGIEVYAREFNASSLDFTVRWWSKSDPLSMHVSRDRVVTAIKYGLDNAGIEIPFPYRTLTFKEPLNLTSREDDSTN